MTPKATLPHSEPAQAEVLTLKLPKTIGRASPHFSKSANLSSGAVSELGKQDRQ